MRFDAGGVPVRDLVFSSKTITVAELQDATLFRVRPLFATLPAVSAPPPFGSSQRTILVRLDPGKLRSYNMSPDEVVRALAAGNTVSPSGNVRIGDLWPTVPVNSVVGDFQVPEQHSDPLAGNADDLHTRYRIGRRRRRHSDRIRARRRSPHRIHPRNQTSGCLDARGRASGQSQLAALPVRFAGRHQGLLPSGALGGLGLLCSFRRPAPISSRAPGRRAATKRSFACARLGEWRKLPAG
jgi:multidrug efflux pump subunit AcrB